MSENNELLVNEEVAEVCLVITLPLDNDQDRADAEALEARFVALSEEQDWFGVDGSSDGEHGYDIYILTDDIDRLQGFAEKIVEDSPFKERAEFDIAEVIDEDFPAHVLLVMPLSDEEDGTEEERNKYTALAARLSDAIAAKDLGQLDTIHFADGEAILGIGCNDSEATAEFLQSLLEGEDIPEESEIHIEEEIDDEDEEEA